MFEFKVNQVVKVDIYIGELEFKINDLALLGWLAYVHGVRIICK
jgi:hypothetical protein